MVSGAGYRSFAGNGGTRARLVCADPAACRALEALDGDLGHASWRWRPWRC
jgi:hypothetical protein